MVNSRRKNRRRSESRHKNLLQTTYVQRPHKDERQDLTRQHWGLCKAVGVCKRWNPAPNRHSPPRARLRDRPFMVYPRIHEVYNAGLLKASRPMLSVSMILSPRSSSGKAIPSPNTDPRHGSRLISTARGRFIWFSHTSRPHGSLPGLMLMPTSRNTRPLEAPYKRLHNDLRISKRDAQPARSEHQRPPLASRTSPQCNSALRRVQAQPPLILERIPASGNPRPRRGSPPGRPAPSCRPAEDQVSTCQSSTSSGWDGDGQEGLHDGNRDAGCPHNPCVTGASFGVQDPTEG